MRRSPVPVAVVTLAVLLVALLAYGLLSGGSSTNLDTAVQRGQQPVAPAAQLRLPKLGASGTIALADLRGQVVVVNVWASWCPPCADEAPILSAMHRALQRAGDGQVLGVTHVDPSQNSLAKVRAWRLPYPSVRDVDDKLYDAFGASAPPETYVINAAGRIVALSRGAITAEFANRALAAAGTSARINPKLELSSAS
ncbi:MAG: redoxin domain-containing protein [Patulibacter sp.]